VPSFPPLVFTTWGLTMVDGVKDKWIDLVAKETTDLQPAQLDLKKAMTRWAIPDPIDHGTIRTNIGEGKDEWVLSLSDLPEPGDMVIRPVGGLRPDAGTGPYAFMKEVDGEPVAYQAGAPIRFAVRSDCAPPEALDLIARALKCVAERTGFTFVFDGTFEGPPSDGHGRVEIGWAFEPEFREWERRNGNDGVISIGRGGWKPLVNADGTIRISGSLAFLNADMDLPVAFSSGPSHGLVLLHELGHGINLGHVVDTREIMNTFVSPDLEAGELDYGPGDRLGMRVISVAAKD